MNKTWNVIVSMISILALVLSIGINNIKLDDVVHMVNDENRTSHIATLSKSKQHHFYEYLISSSSDNLHEEYQQAYELKEMKDNTDDVERYNQLDDTSDNYFL